LSQSEVWEDAKRAEALGKERAQLGETVTTLQRVSIDLADLTDLSELAFEENDEATLIEIDSDLNSIDSKLQALEFRRMFKDPLDEANCYLEVQSGSGGTEAQDWAEMLLRMYLRWVERKGFTGVVSEISDGDVAGIKSATVLVKGSYAYGWLKTETGVHRLVRKSPFDSGNRRHTSFASIFISPEIDDAIEIEINPAEVRVDTYRASGAGGQHVNRTDSAVRLTHLPTNTVVQCQSERSQHQNKDNAFKQLRAKLYELELQQRKAEQRQIEDSKADIGWGSQIRSYVLDQSRVKDIRTNVEVTNPTAVLDGDLDVFIEASLKLAN